MTNGRTSSRVFPLFCQAKGSQQDECVQACRSADLGAVWPNDWMRTGIKRWNHRSNKSIWENLKYGRKPKLYLTMSLTSETQGANGFPPVQHCTRVLRDECCDGKRFVSRRAGLLSGENPSRPREHELVDPCADREGKWNGQEVKKVKIA
ncbi:hypothetical protein GWI33_002644 [Rhynchophorus ferrugineus]|uniref:Uncharacterized protein n=1 Tax=Rhynchophorus ferrugineus TaxID=354439 RepID=A0A834IMC4_RHYFE|nr:hypothetical protein GWI33_002644 [Rhynchophorus ferrugineus]